MCGGGVISESRVDFIDISKTITQARHCYTDYKLAM